MNRQMKQMMEQAQKMQQGLVKLQGELAEARIEGGAGPVKATVNGSGELVGLAIGQEAVETGDAGMLEDMVLAAVRSAVEKSREYSSSRMRELGLPDAGSFL